MFSKLSQQEHVSVLVYHSVGLNDDFYNVNPEEFSRQMEYLRKNYNVVSLDEISNFSNSGKNLPKKAVAITFDDGYYNNYLNAYSYLRKYGLPAAIFITTGYVHKQIRLSTIPLKMLGWNEIKEMSENNITIGAHTMTHPNLQELDLEKAKNEILGSKEEIEKNIGRNAKYFAYPYGKYDNEIIHLVKSMGFNCGFSTDMGLIQKGANPFILNRIKVNSSINFMMFKVRLTKAVDLYKKIEQIAKKIINNFPFMSKFYRFTEY